MASNVDNMRDWNTEGGALWFAPIGTTLPTTSFEIPADFEDIGIISDGGVEESLEVETKETVAWPGGDIVKTKPTKTKKTQKFVALEDSAMTTGLYYGHGKPTLVGTAGSQIARVDLPKRVPVVERAAIIVLQDGDLTRMKCIERIAISERGSYVANTEDDPAYEFTMTETSKGYWLTNEPTFLEAAAVTP